ncbi:hypothetical protein M5K25_019488 [Dendrobium thyrsiflorum]|uniref:Uncharacterized protein n=1 Tax=Dendrobium thyrsiflorum TaxID=117978 RepID=A0ABD0UET7_DENTH
MTRSTLNTSKTESEGSGLGGEKKTYLAAASFFRFSWRGPHGLDAKKRINSPSPPSSGGRGAVTTGETGGENREKASGAVFTEDLGDLALIFESRNRASAPGLRNLCSLSSDIVAAAAILAGVLSLRFIRATKTDNE